MDIRNEIKRLWQTSFNDRPNWIELYFERVFDPKNVLIVRQHEQLVSCMSLIPYKFNYQGSTLPMSYVSGACTDRCHRNAGNMTALMGTALKHSYDRGDDLMALIPANRPLFFFYDKFGFATVFFIKEERYTSLHTFKFTGEFSEISDHDQIYDFLHREELKINGRILHSRKDFDNILWDNETDGGKILAIGNKGHAEALAIVVPKDDETVVKELLAVNENAGRAMLASAKSHFPDTDIVVEAHIKDNERPVEARGMLRIINAYEVLTAIAKNNPAISQTFKISDNYIRENNHIFIIDGGKVTVNDEWKGKIDTEMDIKTMAEVLFNTHATGSLFGVPSVRPSMSLMLE